MVVGLGKWELLEMLLGGLLVWILQQLLELFYLFLYQTGEKQSAPRVKLRETR
jgi:hypothetical protein